LKGGRTLPRTSLFWHYPHYHTMGATPYGAVRDGDLRLIEFQEDGRVELYDLASDVGESKDLASERPQDVERLKTLLARWRSNVGAQMAVPNPNHK
jgi:hypothetical protein